MNEKYLPQNASGLYLSIQKIGCFFRSALNMAEDKAQKALTVEQINKLWDKACAFRYINSENNVTNSAKIANLALEELKISGRFVEVAIFQNGLMQWYSSVITHSADYYIQKIKQGGPSKTHFIRVDAEGRTLFEPHDPPIKKLGIYYTICYRYDK